MLDVKAPTPGPAETPAPAAPAAAPQPEPQAEPSAVDDLYDTAEPEPEPSPEPQPGKTPAAAPKPEETDENTISTVAELIEHHQLDPEWFNTLKVDVKVDRQTTAVPIADLIKSYQIDAAATKRLEDAKTKAATLTSEATVKHEAAHANLTSAAKLIEHVENILERDEKAIDWNKLRAEDPAEWTAKRDEFKERRAEIKALKDQGAKTWRDALASSQTGPTEEQQAEIRAIEKEAMLEAVPEWRDPEKAKAEVRDLTSYLTGEAKFTREEIAGTTDHRLLVIGRKAMLYDRLQTKTDAAKKRIAKVPKTMKPTAGAKPAPAAPASKSEGILKDMYG